MVMRYNGICEFRGCACICVSFTRKSLPLSCAGFVSICFCIGFCYASHVCTARRKNYVLCRKNYIRHNSNYFRPFFATCNLRKNNLLNRMLIVMGIFCKPECCAASAVFAVSPKAWTWCNVKYRCFAVNYLSGGMR